MKKNVVAPSVGESVTEVSILKWAKPHGSAVKNGEVILEIESDKATVEVIAEHTGTLQVLKQAGERIPVGEVVGVIDDAIAASASSTPVAATTVASPAAKAPAPIAAAPGPVTSAPSTPQGAWPSAPAHVASKVAELSPAARRHATELGLSTSNLHGSGKDGRIMKGDVLQPNLSPPVAAPARVTAPQPAPLDPGTRRVPMSMLRQKIAERLVHAQHSAAILTTFNEVDMSAVMKIRSQHKDAFKAKHGVNLSFMSFFTRGCVEALKLIPEVNASIDGKDVLYHDFYDIGIAVGTERGLVVPVIRDVGSMGFVEIEKAIGVMAEKARTGKLSIADLSGGTFTISNGGTYGSLMSTPILNPPQSGILGMHKIMDRPVVIDGKVEVRPMMYLALSYDHRLIDGKGAVTFLVHLKDFLEHPEKLQFAY